MLNSYEHTLLKNEDLPQAWKKESSLKELSEFLQLNWDQRNIFYDDGFKETNQQFLTFTANSGLKTKNYIGTIVFRGEQLNIYPKIFRKFRNDTDTSELSPRDLIYNISQWVKYCNKSNYPFMNIPTQISDCENLRDLFITLYLGYVKKSIERGVFYEYTDITEDCNCIKGKFDVKDFIQNKIPSGQVNRFKCTYSNFEFDNNVNQIIKYTCKGLLNTVTIKNQKIIRQILASLKNVSNVAFTPKDCDKIRLNKLHKNYKIIINMSKMILLNKLSNNCLDKNEAFCFLFPAEKLFEGYVGGFIKEFVEESGGKVSLQYNETSLIDEIIYNEQSYGKAFKMKQDIYIKYNDKAFVLDTKYKQLSRFDGNISKILNKEVEQTDVYQICEYARKNNVKEAFLLYPTFRQETAQKDFPVGSSNSEGHKINIHFLRIPFSFEKTDCLSEKCFKEIIESHILNCF